MRNIFEREPGLLTKRNGVFSGLLEALHRSRRRNAIQVLRRYRHLIAGKARVRPACYPPQSRPTETSSQTADGNSMLVNAIRQARQNARKEFA